MTTNGNNKPQPLQILTAVAQFLLIPLLWLIYQMYLDIGFMKIQMAKLEGKFESHQEIAAIREKNKELERELEEVKSLVSNHRRKSTYDKQ
jgi:hypothetical protein